MKKLFCLLTCLFIGFSAFAGALVEDTIRESDNVVLKYVKNVEDPKIVNKYLCDSFYIVVKAVDVPKQKWDLVRESDVSDYSENIILLYVIRSNKDYSQHYLLVNYQKFKVYIYMIK